MLSFALSTLFLGIVLSHIGHDHTHDELEDINEKAFFKRVVGMNYTEETINGKRVKYYITNTGHWHIDACSVIGKEGIGLMGYYLEAAKLDRRRRLNPKTTDSNGLGTWPNGIVYYDISGVNIPNWQVMVDHYKTVSSVRLLPVTDKTTQHYLRVTSAAGAGCWSYVGRIDRRYRSDYNGQELSLGQGCTQLPTITHEVGHALGMSHTQSRKDRDQYVTIYWDNIQADKKDQYEMETNKETCRKYDCGSVMHYHNTAFAIDRSKITIAPKDPNTCVIGRNSDSPLSEQDKLCLCDLYPPNTNGNSATICGTSSDPSKTPTPQPSKSPLPPQPSAAPIKAPTTNPSRATPQPTKMPSKAPIKEADMVGFCLRGRAKQSTYGMEITGFWVKQSTLDRYQNEWYKVLRGSCKGNDLYIYKRYSCFWSGTDDPCDRNDYKWFIGSTLNGNSYMGLCLEKDIYNCGGKFEIYGSLDNDVTLTVGGCSKVGCDAVSVAASQTSDTSCDGIYNRVSDQDNVFMKNGGSRYLVYNDYQEQFQCMTKNDYESDEFESKQCWRQAYALVSSRGLIPDLTTSDRGIPFTGGEASELYLKCTEIDNRPITTPNPNTRKSLTCGTLLSGTASAGDTILFDYTYNTNNYAVMFTSCFSGTNIKTKFKIFDENLVSEIDSQDYAQYWCSSTPDKDIQVVWTENAGIENGRIYTGVMTAITAGNWNVRINCFANQADALNFGKNEQGEYVPIFSFKAYGPVQWGVFFTVLILLIVLNIVIVFLCVKYIVKSKTKDLETKLNADNHQQTNIQLAQDEYFDGDIGGTR